MVFSPRRHEDTKARRKVMGRLGTQAPGRWNENSRLIEWFFSPQRHEDTKARRKVIGRLGTQAPGFAGIWVLRLSVIEREEDKANWQQCAGGIVSMNSMRNNPPAAGRKPTKLLVFQVIGQASARACGRAGMAADGEDIKVLRCEHSRRERQSYLSTFVREKLSPQG
jgi:hypothetical protein